MAGQVGGVERRAVPHVGDDAGDGAEHAGLGDAELQRKQLAAAVGRDELLQVLDDEVLEVASHEERNVRREGRVELGEADGDGLRDGGSRQVDERPLDGGDAGLSGAEQR